jgi:hypothetical protein
MFFDSNHVIETLERMVQHRVIRLADKNCYAGSLKALVIAAEIEALEAAIKCRTVSL